MRQPPVHGEQRAGLRRAGLPRPTVHAHTDADAADLPLPPLAALLLLVSVQTTHF